MIVLSAIRAYSNADHRISSELPTPKTVLKLSRFIVIEFCFVSIKADFLYLHCLFIIGCIREAFVLFGFGGFSSIKNDWREDWLFIAELFGLTELYCFAVCLFLHSDCVYYFAINY